MAATGQLDDAEREIRAVLNEVEASRDVVDLLPKQREKSHWLISLEGLQYCKSQYEKGIIVVAEEWMTQAGLLTMLEDDHEIKKERMYLSLTYGEEKDLGNKLGNLIAILKANRLEYVWMDVLSCPQIIRPRAGGGLEKGTVSEAQRLRAEPFDCSAVLSPTFLSSPHMLFCKMTPFIRSYIKSLFDNILKKT